MTGYEYFKKQNDWVLKKDSFNDNNKTLRHFKALILLDVLVLQLPRVTPKKRNFMVYTSSKWGLYNWNELKNPSQKLEVVKQNLVSRIKATLPKQPKQKRWNEWKDWNKTKQL